MILKAIQEINPNAEVVVRGDDVKTCEIEWHNGTPEISRADIEIKIAELKADYNSKQYQRDRKLEYPLIADQLDDIYHNGIDGWKETIKAVKDKYPEG